MQVKGIVFIELVATVVELPAAELPYPMFAPDTDIVPKSIITALLSTKYDVS